MIDTKEKLRHCLSIEKRYISLRGGLEFRWGLERKIFYMDMYTI